MPLMSLVDELLRTAYEDTELLRKNNAQGDVFVRPRDVDFLLRAPTQEKADIAAQFITDNQYGRARVQGPKGGWSVLVTINMPIEQNTICSVSALMVCLSRLFGLEYDGWGCVLQRDA